MKLEKIKDMLKDKRNITIAGAVTGVAVIVIAGSILLHNKFNENGKVTDNKVVAVNKENIEEEKAVKEKLENLNKIDISKLSEEDKKSIEDTKKLIEDMISKKEYTKAIREIESLEISIENKFNEMAEKEKEKEEVREENNVEKVEENKEVASNTTNSTSNNTSSNNSSSVSNGNNSSSSSQGEVQQPNTPPVQPAPQPKPEPTPQPPVEEVKPVYPSVAEVKQRLISYGQGLGYTYNSALEGSGFNAGGTSQMWGSGLGGNADGQTLFNGLDSLMVDKEFGITVVDLGNGYVEMSVWIR